MTTSVVTLTDFLLARAAEDEAEAAPIGCDCIDGAHGVRCGRRVLAECEAKRRIVALHGGEHECTFGPTVTDGGFVQDGEVCPTLRLLALPYADDPEYRGEWRPA